MTAMAGDRTRIDCLEGNHADHYTTIADGCRKLAARNRKKLPKSVIHRVNMSDSIVK